MEGRRVPLTPGDTLRFGSLNFVYTGPAESVAGRTFARPPRPDVLTGAAGRATFVRGFSNETIMAMLGQTQDKIILVSPPTTSPSRQAGPSRS
jgi:hypothetical protein